MTSNEANREEPTQGRTEQPASAADGPVLLLATDGSEAAWHAAERAVVLAGLLRARLVVLHAIDVHGAFREGIHYGEAVRAMEQEGQRTTEGVAALAGARGVAHEEVLVAGKPADAILQTAERFGADYVLMGAQGRTRAGQILVGSVSQEVLLRSERTVLLVGGKRGARDPMLDKLGHLVSELDEKEVRE